MTLTLDEAEALLYVGAREAVFALSTGTVELKAAVRLWGGGGSGGRGCRVHFGVKLLPHPLFSPLFCPSSLSDLLGSPRGEESGVHPEGQKQPGVALGVLRGL